MKLINRKMAKNVDAYLLRLLSLAQLLAVFMLLLLSLYNQPYYPMTWLDEGFTLQGAINLVRYGQYAMRSTEGFRVLDQPLQANGPGIVLPLSAVFAMFGIGLLQARLLMAFFTLGTAVTFYYLARRLYGPPSAVISVFLLLALPAEGFLFLGRQALGMIPSLGYFLFGYVLWLRSLENRQGVFIISAGFFFALAMITKGQYMLLIPMLLLVAFLDKLYYRTGSYKSILLVVITILSIVTAWYAIQLVILGWDKFLLSMEALRASSRVTVSAFRIVRIPGNLWYLARSGILLIVVPGWLYGLWEVRKSTKESLRQSFLLIFVPIWLLWFAFVSVGWHRYAFDPYAVGTILAGKYLWDMAQYLRGKAEDFDFLPKYQIMIRNLASVFLVAIILTTILGLAVQANRILAAPDTSAQDFAQYLQRSMNPKSTIESWEWEIDALTPTLNYHHPTNDWVDKLTALTQFGDSIDVNYDFSKYEPDYLIDGPFSKKTGLYTQVLAKGCCTLVTEVGPYNLYSIVK